MPGSIPTASIYDVDGTMSTAIPRWSAPKPAVVQPNDIGAVHAQSFSDALRIVAERDPDRLAFRFLHDGEGNAEQCTYGELHLRARALANQLAQRAGPGTRVLVLCPPGLEYVVALFGCMHAGVVPVPAFPPQMLHRATERLEAILASAETRIAITTTMIRALLPKAEGRNRMSQLSWLTIDRTYRELGDAEPWKPPKTKGLDLALLQYTSGSTAHPRGVMLSHDNLLANCREIAGRMGATGADRAVSWLPPYHDMGLIGTLLTPVLIGANSTLMSPLAFLERPARWLEAISTYAGTISGGPNFAYGLCTRKITEEELGRLDLRSWRIAFNGAERVHASTIRGFSERFGPAGFRSDSMSPCYGLAESTLCVTIPRSDKASTIRSFDAKALEQRVVEAVAPEDEGGVELVSCGEVTDAHRIRIVDPGPGRALPPGQVGEIWVSGPSVGTGYYGEPNASRSTFKAELLLSDGRRYLRTGDLGFLEDGELFVVARLKDLIIIRGRNYFPDDLELVIGQVDPRLRMGGTVAFTVESAEESRLVVVQELREAEPESTEGIAREIREAVARAFQLPIHDLVLVPPRTVPRTSSGKVQRAQTRKLYESEELAGVRVALRNSGAYPRATGTFRHIDDDLEVTISRVMATHLPVEAVRPDEDFFALGGQSLLATRVMSALRESLGIDLPLRLIFDAPTPRRLASAVRSVQRQLEVPRIESLSRDGPLPLSYSQERMLFMHLLDPSSSAYNIAGGLQMDGELVVEAVEGAIGDLMRRHEILRARYEVTSQGPSQAFRAEPGVEVAQVDLVEFPDPDLASDVAASELATAPFDLQNEPLVRVALHRLAPDRHRLVLCVHHIVADGWSLDVALQDFINFYLARSGGAPKPLPPLESQYVDFAAWQRAFLDSDEIRDQMSYWSERLAGAPSYLELPADRPRPERQGYEGDIVELELTSDLVERITEFGREQGATLFMVMLAALDVVLARHTGQYDVCVGTPIANRNWRASEDLIGTFVNTLVMRTDCAGDPTFIELIARVREVCLGAYDHQDVPFERLVDALQPDRDLSHSPLFSVFFDFQTVGFPESGPGGLAFRPVRVQRKASQFDLSLGFLDFGEGMLGAIEYRTDIFDRSTIVGIAEHFMRVLAGAMKEPAAPLSQLPMLSSAERDDVVVLPNLTGAPNDRFRFVHEVVAYAPPSAVAVVQGDEAVTYDELERRKNQLAHHLRKLRVEPGVRVGVLLERGPSLLVALLATMQAGGAYIPLDPAYPPGRVAAMLEDGRPEVVLTSSKLASRVPVGVPTIVLMDTDADRIAAYPDTPPEVSIGGDDLAYVNFTSGSTGRPKGVMVPHRALTNFLHAMAEEPACGPDDRLLSVTTVSFDIAGLELYLPLLAGATVDIVPREVTVDASRLREHIERTQPTMMQATPATWRMLIEAGWQGHNELRVLCGGEALPRDLAEALLLRAYEVWNLYGPTETTIWSAAHRVEAGDGPVSIGGPIRNTQLYVLGRHGEPVPRGVPGELYIGGAGVALGYIGRPTATVERFVPNPFVGDDEALMYRTGDAVKRRPDGTLEFLGRLDRQVKLRGYRIELPEIEAHLRRHPGVADAAVQLIERDVGDARLVGYIVARGPVPRDQDLQRHCRDSLPEFMIPSAFVVLPEFPRTNNGKLDRKALPDPHQQGPTAELQRMGPSSALESTLVELWREVLRLPDVGVTQDFFNLGGHSLLAVRLFVRIEEETGVAIPIGVLFEAPTIRQLAERIEALSAAQ